MRTQIIIRIFLCGIVLSVITLVTHTKKKKITLVTGYRPKEWIATDTAKMCLIVLGGWAAMCHASPTGLSSQCLVKIGSVGGATCLVLGRVENYVDSLIYNYVNSKTECRCEQKNGECHVV
jgi:hypothetical protein